MFKKHPITHITQYYIVPSDCVNGDNVGKVHELWTEQEFNSSSGVYTFAIVSGNTGIAFSINSSTGELTVANASAFTADMNIVCSVTVDERSMNTTCNIRRIASSNCVYIDSTAPGGGNGTRATPYNLFKTAGLGNGTAGKFYLYRRGRTYNYDILLLYNLEASAPITVGAYGSGARPILDGQNNATYAISFGAVFSSGTGLSQTAFNVDVMDIEFKRYQSNTLRLTRRGKNFNFRRLKLGDTTAVNGLIWLGTQLDPAVLYPSDIYGSDIELYGFTDRGLKIERGGEASNPVVFENIKAYNGNNQTYVSAVDNPYVIVRYLHCDHGAIPTTGPNVRHGQQNYEWIYLKDSLRGFYFWKPDNLFSSITGGYVQDIIIDNTTTGDGIQFERTGSATLGHQNYSINRVEIKSPGRHGINLQQGATNITVSYVVIYESGTTGIRTDNTTVGIKIYNAIIVDNATDLNLSNSPEVRNTIYSSLTGSFGTNSNNSTLLTQFVNRTARDYRPIVGSSNLGAGISLGYLLDADNNTVLLPPARGAYELASITPPTNMTYYFSSSSGNDSNNGLSEATAWASLTKHNSSSFSAGDSVLFKRGDLWYGTLTPPSQGVSGNRINYGAYGTGANPIITGEIEITGWVNEGGSVYSKTNAGFTNIQLVTIDGNTRQKGRFPKTSYITATAVTSNTSVTGSVGQLPSSPNYTGGEIVITKISWVQDRGTITNHSGQTLTYTGTSIYNGSVGWGFFIQNHPNCLTEFGDWWFDNTAKKIYMHFGGSTPASHVIKIANTPTILNIISKDYLKFENIDFKYGATECVALTNSEFNIVENCNIRYGALFGIQHYESGGYSDNNTINNCTIEDTYDSAIKAVNNLGTTVTNNIIRRNYIHPGTTQNGDGKGSTVALGINNVRGGNYVVEDNLIEDSGYDAIHFSMSNVSVRRNDIYRSCLVKEDGGAIYCFGIGGGASYVNRHIKNNFITDTIALNVPNGYNVEEVYSIYLDEDSQNVEIDNNTIINSSAALYINNSKNNTFRNNKIYNNSYTGIYIRSQGATYASTENTITGNDFYSLTGNMIRISSNNALNGIGTINTNRYVKPNGGVLFDINFGAVTYTTIAAWNAAYGYDSASTASPTASLISQIYTNKTSSIVSTAIGTSRKDLSGTSLSSPQNIAADYSLIVLEGSDSTPTTSTTSTTSGITSTTTSTSTTAGTTSSTTSTTTIPTPTTTTTSTTNIISTLITDIGVYTNGLGFDTITFNNANIGNLLIVMAHQYADTGTSITPSGWTLAHTSSRNKVFTRIKQSGDPIETTFIRTGAFDYDLVYLVGVALTGTGTTITFGALGSSNYFGSAVLPSVTYPSSDSAFAIAFAGSRYSNTSPHVYSSGWNREQRYERSEGQTGVLSWATKLLPIGGASGSATVTNNSDMEGLIYTLDILGDTTSTTTSTTQSPTTSTSTTQNPTTSTTSTSSTTLAPTTTSTSTTIGGTTTSTTTLFPPTSTTSTTQISTSTTSTTSTQLPTTTSTSTSTTSSSTTVSPTSTTSTSSTTIAPTTTSTTTLPESFCRIKIGNSFVVLPCKIKKLGSFIDIILKVKIGGIFK